MKYILLLLLCLTTSAFAESRYTAIFDAGSSGTRLHLYSNTTPNHKHLSVKNIEVDGLTRIEPGVSSFQTRPKAIKAYLKPLLNNLQQTLAEHDIKPEEVDTYFLATAGMRLIPIKQQSTIFKQVTRVLKHYKFNVKEVKTIPGWQEGVFGWVSVNFLKGTLDNNTSKPTYGLMDLGGASTQITFEANKIKNKSDIHSITVHDHHYKLYSESFLGLGGNKIGDQVKNHASCFPTGYPMENGNEGKWNLAACQTKVEALIQEFSVPHLDIVNTTSFIGISLFYYTADSAIFDLKGKLSIKRLQQATDTSCSKSWNTLKAMAGSDSHIATRCRASVHIISLLTHYGFSPNTNIQVLDEVNGINASWAYGANVYYALQK